MEMKRGPKPKELVKIKWSPNFAYAIGLLATDGCISRDGLLVDLTSKDKDQLVNFKKCLDIQVKIGEKFSGFGIKYWRVQFKNRLFYDFLLSIGFTPAKSKTIGKIDIPEIYFYDFLRGCFDGDGTFYSYWDPRWKSSFMFYTEFISASAKHIEWIRKQNEIHLDIRGHIGRDGKRSTYQLKYAKGESLKVLARMYHSKDVVCLARKKLKIAKALGTIGLSVKHISSFT
jgi:hypothetical protein